MATDPHDRLGIYASSTHVRDRGMPQVMKTEILNSSAFDRLIKPPPKSRQ
jgi:hypothetical protein